MIRTTALAALLLTVSVAEARTKLTTIPDRDRVIASVENRPEALLSEERDLALQQGANQIDFSWKGVSIDPDSVLLEFLTHPGDGPEATKMIAVALPPNEAALTWQVFSPEARTERIRVSYLLNGISHQSSYEFRVDAKETGGDFQQQVLLTNQSGEDLDDALLRLRGLEDLSRSVDSGESRRFLALRNKELPIRKLFVARPGFHEFQGEEGESIALVYEIENSEKGGLGKALLPDGKVRLYGDDGTGSSIFLGEDMMAQTPPGEKAELTLGSVRDVVLKRRLLNQDRKNVKFNIARTPVLFDVERQVRYELENFKDQPVTLKIHEPMLGDWSITGTTGGTIRTTRKTQDEVELEIDLPAAEKGEAKKQDLVVTFTIKNVFPNEL